MHSHRSEYSDRRPHSDKGSRQWDAYDDREEGSDRNHRNDRDSCHRYDGDGHSRTERISGSREYSDSPKRTYSKDSLNRNWSRKSPVRRRIASPDRMSLETKRRRFDKNHDNDYRHRHEPEDVTYRQSAERFSQINVSKDFKHTLPQNEDTRYNKTTKDSRHRHLDEEITYKKQHVDYRPLSPYHKERDCYERSWDCLQDRTRSQDCIKENPTKPRERNAGPYDDYKDQCDNRNRFLSNGSSEQSSSSDFTNLQSSTAPGQKPTKGFQRFLDVLNKGVNVAMLTKIVTQTSAVATDQPCSPGSFTNTTECLQFPISAERQQGRQSNSHWSEFKVTQRLASPHAQSEQRSEGGQSCLTSHCRSQSPSVGEKMTLTPEDEHRHRQMQGVLQAIGIDLGLDELGQMSHRIQERLYGKKSEDWGHDHRGSKERDTRRMSPPSRQSRSSSSRSNASPLSRDYSMTEDCYSAESDVTNHIQLHQAGECGQNSSSSSSSSLLNIKKCEMNSQENSATSEVFSPDPAYTLSEAPATPVVPTYSPYPPMTPALPPVPPYLPPHLPHAAPRVFLPCLNPILPYANIPPLNIFPSVLTPAKHLLPKQISNTQSPLFNLPDVNPTQSLNATQKSKTLSRPRCLQVIETKQPG